MTCLCVFLLVQIGNNLKYWPDNHEVVSKTLQLFLDMASGYSSSKMLLGLDTVKFLMHNHTEEFFPFLVRKRRKTSCNSCNFKRVGWTGVGEKCHSSLPRVGFFSRVGSGRVGSAHGYPTRPCP